MSEFGNSIWGRLNRSLSLRLLILFALFTVAILFTLKFAVGFALDSQFKENIRPHVAQYFGYLRQEIGDPPSIERARKITERLPIDIAIVSNGEKWSSLGIPIDFESIEFHRHKRRNGKLIQMSRYQNRFILKTTGPDYQLYLMMPERPKFIQSDSIVLIAIALVLLLTYLCYRTIRWLFQPVADIQRGVASYSQGDFDHLIPLRRNDDLGVLVQRINTMASDIKNMLDAKRQLMLGVSHELRSPITRAKVNLALLPDSQYKDALDTDLAEMEAMISELLESERLNTSHSSLELSSCDLASLAEEVINESFNQEHVLFENGIGLLDLKLDVKRIKLLLRNLIANALRHTRSDQAAPIVRLYRNEHKVVLSVIDHGVGIAPEHIEHLTEPFYRADSARARHTGGYGLGLYLCRLIAEAHGGELDIQSEQGVGTTVSVILP